MNEMLEFLTSKEIIVVYIVVGIAILICLAIFIIDKSYDKRKRRQNTRKLNKLVEDVNLRLQEGIEVDEKEVEPIKQDEQLVELHVEEPVGNDYVDFIPPTPNSVSNSIPVLEDVQPVVVEPTVIESTNEDVIINNMDVLEEESKESIEETMSAQIDRVHDKIEQIVYATNPEPDREEATRELIKLTEELEKAEMAQRQGIDIAAYENAQEENAIISLEELTKRSEEMYAANEQTQYADEGNEPISLADLEMRKAQVMNSEINNEAAVQDTVIVEKEEVVEIQQEQMSYTSTSEAYKGHKVQSNSAVFSSVFGTGSRNGAQTEEELQKTSEFLLSLKELQSRLNS